MADTKLTALSNFTPILTDHLYGVDDPGGTPTSGKFTLSSVQTLFAANISLDTARITTGTFADARIAESNVTQHEAALSITESQISDFGTYLTDVVSDTTPQLGGSLDVNSNKIVSTANGNIDIEPHGTGNVLLGNLTFDADQTVGAGQDNYALVYDNTGGLIGLEELTTAHITSGTFADARIAESNVTQHEAALTITESQISDLGAYITDVTGDNLSALADVTITTIASGEILAWNGSAWVNNTLAEAGIQAAGSYLTDILSDTSPQLGGMLDINGNAIGDGTRELITFTEDASAVNHLNVENQATGSGPILSAAGDDTNIDLVLNPKGSGDVILGNYTLDADATIGAGQDNYVLTYDNTSGTWRPEAAAGGGGDLWSDPIDSSITVDTDSLYDLAATGARLANIFTDAITITNNITVGGTVDGRDVATDGSKLDGIEALADVTDATNVTAAGALMDSEVTNLAQVKAFDATDYATAAQGTTADSAMQDLADDITPQLGADLDVVTFSIVSTTNRDITIAPNGTGNVVLGNFTIDADQTLGAGQDNYVLTYDDASGTWSAEAAPGAGGGINDIVEDTTPQLGGMLDVNTFAIGDGTRELITFTEDASAVNQINIENQATGGGPILSAAGDDTNIDLVLSAKGTGNIDVGNFSFDGDQTVGAGQDNYVLTYDNGTGLISLEAATGGSGDLWSDPVDAVITPDADGTRDLATTGTRFATGYLDNLDITTNITVGGTVDGRDIAADGSKLDGIEALADVTDATNVTAAGALMDSEVTNLAQVKAFDATDYATAAQGATADSALQDILSDTTPQLGGMLDVNGNAIGDGTRELVTFTEDASAVNHINIENQATGSGPILSAAGDDAAVDLVLAAKGTGNISVGNFTFDADQTVGAGQDNYVLTYDNGTGLVSLEAAAGGGGGNAWSDPIDSNITTTDSTYDIGTDAARVANFYADDIFATSTVQFGQTTQDIEIERVAAQTLGVHDDTNEAELRVYGSTDGTFTNTTYGYIGFGFQQVEFGSTRTGTGAEKNVAIVRDGTTKMTFEGSNLKINTGTLPSSHDTYAFGNSTTMWAYGGFKRGVLFGDVTDHPITPTTGLHQLWVRDTDNALIYTDEAGTDTDLTAGGGGGLSNVVDDTTPQLGGMLDVNGQAIGDGTLELLAFTETASAVNHVNITNATTTNGPTLSAVGDDTNIDLVLAAKGTGNVTLGNFTFDADQTVGAGQDNYVFTYDNGTGLVSLEAAAGGGGSAGKNNYWIDAGAMLSRVTNGPAYGSEELVTNDIQVDYWAFDASTEEGAQFKMRMPEGWDEGTVTARFIWSHDGGTSFGVVWSIAGMSLSDSGAIDTAMGTAVTVTDTGATTDDVYISDETSAVTIAGTPAAGDVCWFEVKRVAANGSDTLDVDARLLGVSLYFTRDSLTD